MFEKELLEFIVNATRKEEEYKQEKEREKWNYDLTIPRTRAEGYEKFTRAFALGPTFAVRLTVEDVTYFGLGE